MDWKLKIEDIVRNFFETKKNSNSLLELETLLLSSNVECVLSSLEAVSTIFSKLFSQGMMNCQNQNKKIDYSLWLFERYEDVVSYLISYLLHENTSIQVSSLRVLLSFLQLQSKFPCQDGQINKIFPFCLFQKIVSSLLSNEMDMSSLIEAFKEYICYDDMKFYTLKSIHPVLSDLNEVSYMCLQNCISLLCSVKFPQDFSTINTFTESETFQMKEKPFRKVFSSAWACVLNNKLPSDQLKRVLFILNDSILPHLQNPCILTDFLVNAYNSGGVLSLLALKGLFVLMDQYNLEYPDFFLKLYALLNPKIVNGKFGAHFFSLSRLFLSSTHLPSHLVAAFVKKFSRLSLVSNTSNILKIQSIINNLLYNHPSLKTLVHKVDETESEVDCFDETIKNPAESRAVMSSLWEIKTLLNHIYPQVCSNSKRLTSIYPVLEINIPNESMNNLYFKERKRKFEDVPLAIEKPQLKKIR